MLTGYRCHGTRSRIEMKGTKLIRRGRRKSGRRLSRRRFMKMLIRAGGGSKCEGWIDSRACEEYKASIDKRAHNMYENPHVNCVELNVGGVLMS